MDKYFFGVLYLLFCVNVSAQTSSIYPIQKSVTCRNAAVVSAHALASEAGLEILKMGGNAFDAAITVQFVLAVVYPGAGNLGGGGFLVGHLHSGENISIDFREKAPEKAARDMYLDKEGNPNLLLSKDGHRAAAVPGTVAGIISTLPYARLPLQTLIQPAIQFAQNGFPLTAVQAASLNEMRADFIRNNKIIPVFVKDNPWKEGDLLVQKDLAKTLQRISRSGQKGFYEGRTARLIIKEMLRGNGIINQNDLKAYKTVLRPPIIFNYKQHTIVSMPLPSSGGIMLQQMMKMVENRNIGQMGFHSPEVIQLMVEVERRAYADRAAYLGDIDFVKVPVKKLLDEDYLADKMKDFITGKAGNSNLSMLEIFPESEETTHISILDTEGNAVAVTTTLNGSYGSRTVVSGAGFLLNNEMDDFSIKPGVPNMYGAVGNEKNAIQPGKRMLSSMTPTIVLRNNLPEVITGSPGGTTIITSVFQTLMNLLEFNMSAEDAVNKPKFHHQWLPDVVYVENDFPQHLIAGLEKMGYVITKRSTIGRTELVNILYSESKIITAVADSRGEDAATGY